MKLGELSKKDTRGLPEIPSSEVAILWLNDFYDGPTSGMAEVRGSRYLFGMTDRDALGRATETRQFWLIMLQPDQLEEEERGHELSSRHVGMPSDYAGQPPLPADKVCLEAFYKPYESRTPPDYGNNEVIDWFHL